MDPHRHKCDPGCMVRPSRLSATSTSRCAPLRRPKGRRPATGWRAASHSAKVGYSKGFRTRKPWRAVRTSAPADSGGVRRQAARSEFKEQSLQRVKALVDTMIPVAQTSAAATAAASNGRLARSARRRMPSTRPRWNAILCIVNGCAARRSGGAGGAGAVGGAGDVAAPAGCGSVCAVAPLAARRQARETIS